MGSYCIFKRINRLKVFWAGNTGYCDSFSNYPDLNRGLLHPKIKISRKEGIKWKKLWLRQQFPFWRQLQWLQLARHVFYSGTNLDCRNVPNNKKFSGRFRIRLSKRRFLRQSYFYCPPAIFSGYSFSISYFVKTWPFSVIFGMVSRIKPKISIMNRNPWFNQDNWVRYYIKKYN